MAYFSPPPLSLQLESSTIIHAGVERVQKSYFGMLPKKIGRGAEGFFLANVKRNPSFWIPSPLRWPYGARKPPSRDHVLSCSRMFGPRDAVW